MRENFVGIRPVAKLWLAGNNRLDIREQTEGIWRRYREIPFERVFPEDQRDKHLEAKLCSEAQGILAWIVRACLDWQKHGLGKSTKVQAATADYRSEVDRLAPFIEERCVVAPSATVTRAAIYEAYLAWTERKKSHAMSDKSFAELMRGKGFQSSRQRLDGKVPRVWIGVGLRCDPRDPDSRQNFPITAKTNLSREDIGKNRRESGSRGSPDALDFLAQLDHCLRVRPDSTASDEDRQALAEHFRGLNGTAEAAGQRLWDFWRSALAPTVGGFLASERGGSGLPGGSQ
jgi:phage/plasmid-associated DNA primase